MTDILIHLICLIGLSLTNEKGVISLQIPNFLSASTTSSGFVIKRLFNRDPCLNISENSVSLKLCGKKPFTLREIETLADAFNCSLDYLVGRTGYTA